MADRPHPFEIAAGLISPQPDPFADRYWSDPAAFARECISWPDGTVLADFQGEILTRLVKHRRLAVRGPHGLGKTATEAIAVLWFALTRDAAGTDWKCPTTAGVWRQLEKFAWPEIHRWAGRLNWRQIGRDPFTRHELGVLTLRLRHGEAFALASDDPAAIEGAHATQLLYVLDEAKAIPAATYDATEGAFAGAGDDTESQAFALVTSTPGEPSGRFYAISRREPGLEDWSAYHVKLDQAVEAGRISRSWAEQRRVQWGSTSAVFQNRVLGEFASSAEDTIIPLAWVEAATERWPTAHPDCGWNEGEHSGCRSAPAGKVVVGVDVGRGGDRSVLALRQGDSIDELRRSSSADLMHTVGRVRGVLDAYGGQAVIDVIGIGAGVVDRLRENAKLRPRIHPFNASAGTSVRDHSGELRFVNLRAAAWWRLRELLDPTGDREIALPPDDSLIGDLSAPRWRVTSAGKIQVESKTEIRKRLGRSTDDGDAVVMAFWGQGARRPQFRIASSARPTRVGARRRYSLPRVASVGPWPTDPTRDAIGRRIQ
ncbi:MAG: hypothetical protein WD739_10980 [Actinomycetota bacterium]